MGFEFTRKRSFNNIERTAGTVKQWKAVVSSANGSQTDHGSVITRKELTQVVGILGTRAEMSPLPGNTRSAMARTIRPRAHTH